MNWLVRLYRAWLNRHDPAWKPTGVIVRFAEYDQSKAPQAAKRQAQFEQARRKAAASRARPAKMRQAQAPVLQISKRAR